MDCVFSNSGVHYCRTTSRWRGEELQELDKIFFKDLIEGIGELSS